MRKSALNKENVVESVQSSMRVELEIKDRDV